MEAVLLLGLSISHRYRTSSSELSRLICQFKIMYAVRNEPVDQTLGGDSGPRGRLTVLRRKFCPFLPLGGWTLSHKLRDSSNP